jgi:ATP-binding cassette, subfamily A (ABC1), member 3
LTVYENLEFYARIKGIPFKKIKIIIMSLMKELNLAQYYDKISGSLSGGNKRKLSVGIAMIGNPPIILLDEPSNGMDPEARRFMWAFIHKISKRSKMSSVILTTHSMEEAETLCKRIGIMVGGQFKCLGTSQSIKDKYGSGFEIDLRIKSMPENLLNETLNFYNLNSKLIDFFCYLNYLKL